MGCSKEEISLRNNRGRVHARLLPRSSAEVGRWRYLEPIILRSSVAEPRSRVIGSEGKQPSDGTPLMGSILKLLKYLLKKKKRKQKYLLQKILTRWEKNRYVIGKKLSGQFLRSFQFWMSPKRALFNLPT